jgi:trigger factor
VDAAVEEARVDLPDELITARASERWERLERELAARGIDPDAYLRMQGRSRDQMIDESKPDAERELKRDAVLEAIADAEEVEVTDEEMVEALAHTAEHERTTPEKLLERLRANGRDALIRQDLRMRKALDLLAESAKPIPMAQADARERLWTPEKERAEAEEGPALWTPGGD